MDLTRPDWGVLLAAAAVAFFAGVGVGALGVVAGRHAAPARGGDDVHAYYADGSEAKVGDLVRGPKPLFGAAPTGQVVLICAGNELAAVTPGPVPSVYPLPKLGVLQGDAKTFTKVQ